MGSTGSGRTRRFSLPDLADDRVEGAVTAFLHGPERSRGRSEVAPARPGENAFVGLETRIAWMDALKRESARNLRYRRPVAILVLGVEPSLRPQTADAWVARVMAPIAHSLRRAIRETDLVTRASDARFHVLLPETTAREAQRVADRVIADCHVWLRAMDAPVVVRSAVVATSPDVTVEAALAQAVEMVDPAEAAAVRESA